MPSTYSSSLRLELIATGEQSGTWGDTTNTNLGTLLEQAIAGVVTVTHDNTANYTLTSYNGLSDEARNAVLNITGTLTAARNVVCPTKAKVYVIKNATTGGYAVTLKTSGGTGISVPNGKVMFLYCDGTNVVDAISYITALTAGSLSLTSALTVGNGGTGITSYTTGDIIYASGSTTLSALADVATGSALISGGVGTAPSWGKVGLTTHISGTLPTANGGTNLTSFTNNGAVYATSTSALTTGTLPVASGGTGATTLTGLVLGNGTSAFTTVTAPSGTVVGTSDTQTLTNKRVNARVSSTASISSPLAWNSDSYDVYAATAQTAAFTISADAGTPVDGQKMVFRFQDDGTARTITFTGGSSKSFQPVGVTLTASGSNWTYTTTISKLVYFGCIYNAADSRWDVVALAQE